MKTYNALNNNNISSQSSENIFRQRKKPNYYFEKKIFKIIGYIYFYEKEIKKILNKKDKKEKDFYLINYEWLIDFKKKYSNMTKTLKYFRK